MSGDGAGGIYTRVIDLATPVVIDVGALGEHRFERGVYAYTDSALGVDGDSHVELVAEE
ncbi:hypothetical protein [Halorubrum sp. HHNYT27]|uniref:hypothetical protein n=1 Tax=Halorubrum sp. HHNYT27 TaxID=3402275 RepID=UPI003EB6B1F6